MYALAASISPGDYRVSRPPVSVGARAASAAKAATSAMCAQWLVEDTILERLSPAFEDMARALGQLIQAQ